MTVLQPGPHRTTASRHLATIATIPTLPSSTEQSDLRMTILSDASSPLLPRFHTNTKQSWHESSATIPRHSQKQRLPTLLQPHSTSTLRRTHSASSALLQHSLGNASLLHRHPNCNPQIQLVRSRLQSPHAHSHSRSASELAFPFHSKMISHKVRRIACQQSSSIHSTQ
ncbi:hypothetical protein BLNAU_19662 [Blattamonas nauphoetae]|uniref:Uncharacterized protein n=1 Tax=Blattamonas nauphoetae TaxID=2049346 RepID=A0ABQ9X1C0_9EUKA|nr:hypothetical protein BLNAU_19662 [Blattamonas nauphoetae]